MVATHPGTVERRVVLIQSFGARNHGDRVGAQQFGELAAAGTVEPVGEQPVHVHPYRTLPVAAWLEVGIVSGGAGDAVGGPESLRGHSGDKVLDTGGGHDTRVQREEAGDRGPSDQLAGTCVTAPVHAVGEQGGERRPGPAGRAQELIGQLLADFGGDVAQVVVRAGENRVEGNVLNQGNTGGPDPAEVVTGVA